MSMATDYRSPKKEKFLQAYASLGKQNEAAKIAGCHPNAHYTWMSEDPDYPARFAAAKEMAIARAEDEVVRRGVDGWEEPVYGTVYSGGKPCGKEVVGHIRKYSDVLLIFLLKALSPEKYRDRHEHAVKHSVDRAPLPLEALYEDLTSEPEPIDVESAPKLEEKTEAKEV